MTTAEAAEKRFDEFRKTYGRLVKSLIARIRHSPDNTGDYEQSVWLVVWRELLEDPNRPAVGKWFRKIVENVVISGRRDDLLHHGDECSLSDLDDSDSDESRPLGQPEAPLADAVEVPDLSDAVSNLPADLAELIHRRFFQGETIPEIRASTGLGQTAIEEMITEAYRLIRASVRLQHDVSMLRGTLYSHSSPARKRHEVGNWYRGQATVTRERLSTGRWIFTHRPLSRYFLTVEAQRWRHVTQVPVVAPAVRERPSQIRRRRAPNGLTDHIRRLLGNDPGLTIDDLTSITGASRNSVRAIRSRLLRESD